MDRPHWPQEIVVKPMEKIIPNSTNNNLSSKPCSSGSSFERSSSRIVRPSSQKAAPHVNCPRCDSTNTKFCYYNNYSLSQPRYFCKTCRRYWTEGGTLRNIPVGGGSRKNKRSSSSYNSSISKKLPNDDLVKPYFGSTSILSQQNHYGGQDLNLGFSSTQNFKNFSEYINQVPNSNTNSGQLSALELLTGITTRGGSFMPIPVSDNSAAYNSAASMIPNSMPEFKFPSSLGFSLDGMENGGNYGNSSLEESRLLFPFEELKTNTTSTATDHDDQQNGDHHSNGFWNGMMGGGSW